MLGGRNILVEAKENTKSQAELTSTKGSLRQFPPNQASQARHSSAEQEQRSRLRDRWYRAVCNEVTRLRTGYGSSGSKVRWRTSPARAEELLNLVRGLASNCGAETSLPSVDSRAIGYRAEGIEYDGRTSPRIQQEQRRARK